MKTILAALFLPLCALADSNSQLLDTLAAMPGKAGDTARQIQYIPPVAGELPVETAARRSLIELRADLSARGLLTPELQAAIDGQIAAILSASAARHVTFDP